MITQDANTDDENTQVIPDEQTPDLSISKANESEDHTNKDEPENSHENEPVAKSTAESENKSEAIRANSSVENPALEAAMSPSFEESSSFEEMDKKKRLRKMLINVIVLGMSFLLMYTAFQVRNKMSDQTAQHLTDSGLILHQKVPRKL